VTDQKARFAASGWTVLSCDGHDPDDIDRALTEAKPVRPPHPDRLHDAYRLRAPGRQDTAKGHGSPDRAAELIAEVRRIYGWPHAPFEIPADVKAAWEAIGARAAPRADWEARFARNPLPGKQAEFDRVMSGEAPKRSSPPASARSRRTSRRRPRRSRRARRRRWCSRS
jgi:transketolase